MKILQVTPRYPPQYGGVETHVKEISEWLVERGHAVTVISADAGGEGERREQRNGVSVRRYRSIAPDGAMHLCPQIAVAVRRSDMDVIHAHNYHSLPWLFAAVGTTDQPFIITTHYHGESASPVRDQLLSWYHIFTQRAIEQAEEAIAVSEWEQKQLASDFDVESSVIPNGVEVDQFRTVDPIERSRPYLLTVGRLEEYKGVQHIIQAMKHIQGYDLLITGSGPYKNKLKRFVSEAMVEDRIEFLGYVDDVKLRELYTGAAVYVTLSNHEAYGITVAEALTAGTPTVVLRKKGLTEWESKTGVVGVDSVSPDAISKAIIRARDIEVQWTPLTWNEVTSRVEQIYDGVLCSKPASITE